MKYPHIVVRNGVWYPAGTEVPAEVPLKTETVADVPAETERTVEALADMSSQKNVILRSLVKVKTRSLDAAENRKGNRRVG